MKSERFSALPVTAPVTSVHAVAVVWRLTITRVAVVLTAAVARGREIVSFFIEFISIILTQVVTTILANTATAGRGSVIMLWTIEIVVAFYHSFYFIILLNELFRM